MKRQLIRRVGAFILAVAVWPSSLQAQKVKVTRPVPIPIVASTIDVKSTESKVALPKESGVSLGMTADLARLQALVAQELEQELRRQRMTVLATTATSPTPDVQLAFSIVDAKASVWGTTMIRPDGTQEQIATAYGGLRNATFDVTFSSGDGAVLGAIEVTSDNLREIEKEAKKIASKIAEYVARKATRRAKQ